jgi:hypothetical protein
MVELPNNEQLGVLAGALLADAAFVFAEPSPSFSPKGKTLFLARISLISDEPWELMVVAEAELARSLAANLLGIEEESEEAQKACGEALGEWANIFAGTVALECKGGNAACQIGIPAVTAEAGVKASAFLGKALRRANLVTETGQHMAVALRVWEAA